MPTPVEPIKAKGWRQAGAQPPAGEIRHLQHLSLSMGWRV